MASARLLTSDDWALWKELRLRALADMPKYGPALLKEQQLEDDDWRARVVEPSAAKVVGLSDAGIGLGISAAFLRPADPLAAEVFSVWVDRGGRGRGIAPTMMAVVEAWAVAQRCERLVLKVFADNAVAQRLYDRLGYVRTGITGRHQLTGEAELEMARQLNA